MKKAIFISVLVFVSLLFFHSCSNYGYPDKVLFPSRGGVMEVKGNEFCHSFEIRDYDGNGNHIENEWPVKDDVGVVKYDWLTLKITGYNTMFTLEAEPNTTGKRRVLYVGGMVRNLLMEIKVVQE